MVEGDFAGLQNFSPEQSSTASGAEQIVDLPRQGSRTANKIVDILVSGGGLQGFRPGQSSTASSSFSVSRSPTDVLNTANEELFEGCFCTFPRPKKSASECGAVWARQLIHAERSSMARARDALQGSGGLQGVLPGQSSTRGVRLSDAAAHWQAWDLGSEFWPKRACRCFLHGGCQQGQPCTRRRERRVRAALRCLRTGCLRRGSGANLDYGVLAVLMAKTAAWTTRRRRRRGQRHGVRLASSCCFDSRVVRASAVFFLYADRGERHGVSWASSRC